MSQVIPNSSDPLDPASPAPPARGKGRPAHAGLAGNVRTVSLLILASRVLGLIREVITVRIFGATPLGSAFNAALALPNLFRRLLGEGALGGAFLPEYAILQRDDPTLAVRFASLTVALLLAASGGLCLLVELVLAGLLLGLPPDPNRTISLQLMMITIPYMPLVCVVGIQGGMLQVHGRFAASAAGPILLNIFLIAAGLIYLGLGAPNNVWAAFLIAAATVLAGLVQVAWSMWQLRRYVRWTRVFTGARESAVRMLKRFVPVLIGLGTLQVNAFVSMGIAMLPVWAPTFAKNIDYPLDDTSYSILNAAQRLYQFPMAVFGIAVSTAVFPLLSKARDRPDEFVTTLRRGLRLSFFLAFPATVGLILVRRELTHVTYGGPSSKFDAAAIVRAAAVLLGYSPAIWAYAQNHVITRAFYALGDTKVPMRVAIRMVFVNLVLNLTLIWVEPLRENALAWGSAATAFVQYAILAWIIRGRVHVPIANRETRRAAARIVFATAVMAGGVYQVLRSIPAPTSWGDDLVRLGAAVGTGGVLYLMVATVLRQPELRWLVARSPRQKPELPPAVPDPTEDEPD